MKNIIKFLGIITLITTIGFSLVSCGSEEEESGLTITNLDKYKGKYAVAVEDINDTSELSGLIAADSIDIENMIVTCGKVGDDSVNMKVWKAEREGTNPVVTEYTGNDSVSFYVVILRENTISADTFAGIDLSSGIDSLDNKILLELLTKVAGFGKIEVIFKNGTASGKFIEGSLLDLLGRNDFWRLCFSIKSAHQSACMTETSYLRYAERKQMILAGGFTMNF